MLGYVEPGGGGDLITILGPVSVLILAGTIPAIIAMRKGQKFVPWLLYGILLWPVALIHSLLLRNEGVEVTRACPHCAERVKKEAKVCKHCGRDLEPVP